MAFDVIYSESMENIGTSAAEWGTRVDFYTGSSFPMGGKAGGLFGTGYLGMNATGVQDMEIWNTVTTTGQTTAFLAGWFYLENGELEEWSLIEGGYLEGLQHVTVRLASNNLEWEAFRGGIAGTSLGTGVDAVPELTWFHLEIRVVMSATVGEVQVRRNGVQVLNITGANTIQTGGGLTGVIDGYHIQGNGASGDAFNIDDLIMQGNGGDWMGRHRIRTELVNASSTETDWTSVSGSSNHSNVDESTPDFDTSYNWSGSTGQRDRYGFVNPAFAGQAVAINCRALVSLSDPGSATVKVGIRSEAGSEDLSTGQTPKLLGQYKVVHHVVGTNPDDAGAWEQTDLDTAEIVVELN